MANRSCTTVISNIGYSETILQRVKCGMIEQKIEFEDELQSSSFFVKNPPREKNLWVAQNEGEINVNADNMNYRSHIYLFPSPTYTKIINSLKTNKHLEIDIPFTRTFTDGEIFVKTPKTTKIICEPLLFTVKTTFLETLIKPIIEEKSGEFFVKGKTDSCTDGKTENSIKGFKFVAQKGTYVELSLDFLKEDVVIDTITGLPNGLIFKDGKVRGTPTLSGEFPFTVNISDGSSMECIMEIPQLIRLL